MKILHVIPSMNPSYGGPCQGIRNMDFELNRLLNIDREIVCLSDNEESSLNSDKFVLHALGRGDKFWSYNIKLKVWLEKNIERFDVVILNGLWQYHSYIVHKMVKKFKKKYPQTQLKLVVMPHGGLDPWFQLDKSRRLKAIRNYIYWEIVEKKIINCADAIFFTCEDELLLARSTFSQYCPKLELNVGYGVPNPPTLSDEMYSAFFEKLPQLKGKPYWLFLSRIHPKKGVDLLLKAYKLLLDNYERDRIPQLVIAGPGADSEYGKEIVEFVNEESSLKSKVIFTGMIGGNTKWGALYGCEIFILPSHQENFGIAIVEAMACGKPILTTDKVNIWREIKKGGGLIGSDNTEDTFLNLKKWLLLGKIEKDELARRSRQAFESNFTIEKGVNGFYSGLQKVIKT